MKTELKRNLPASIRARLLNLSRLHREDFQVTLIRYGLERFLYRLGESELRGRFVLKGAALFTLWFDVPHRPTHDLDLLGLGNPGIAQMIGNMRVICAVPCDDGLVFDPDHITAHPIQVDAPYVGTRVNLHAVLVTAQIGLQIDIGIGDAVFPAPEWVAYRTMLDLPAPRVRAYVVYTTVAEKFHAGVILDLANTRMKDFYDLWYLSREKYFDGALLSQAIQTTFQRRSTTFPARTPAMLSERFRIDPIKEVQWRAFLNKNQLSNAPPWAAVTEHIQSWLGPVFEAVRAGQTFDKVWQPPLGWR